MTNAVVWDFARILEDGVRLGMHIYLEKDIEKSTANTTW